MSNKMLIDAIHSEETRVVVMRDKRVEDFDFEAASKRPLRGNIYLAKVTRVEPSLQAAFVEYGGNRHGFLSFSEIHPDYYQIPQVDRAALLEDERRAGEAEEAEAEEKSRKSRGRRSRARKSDEAQDAAADDAVEAIAAEETDAEPSVAPVGDEADTDAPDADIAAADDETQGETGEDEQLTASAADDPAPDAQAAGTDEPSPEDGDDKPKRPRRRRSTKKSDDGLADPVVSEDDEVTSHGGADVAEEIPDRKRRPQRRHYKIQEVIKRRQILLVQVVKEERGTKGAALTTYLSLAGRYSVLMPNTDRGGGVSRKITDNADRKRLKTLVAELEVPEGMGIILRTAGASRTRTEIKRDFEYLLRLWESVRDLTLKSIAPELVYEEGNLVKRAIRDLYNKDIDEILVSGDAAYREAKDFMRMLMPSHAKNVQQYREPTPIFTAYAIEPQLDAMFSERVNLPSKGYIIINPTEALISIDVNSGRSIKESNIEDTATKTNLEAADEVARQLRLRDLAGLIVIDFIDMDDKRHNRQVEKRLKDALKLDRSRIQVGRISSFGLLEMSRQRIRQGMVETSMVPCDTCAGTGLVRSTPSVALHCLRVLEEHLLKQSNRHVTLKTSAAVALYILNNKRTHLNELEDRFGLEISVDADETLSGQYMEILAGDVAERDPGVEPPTAQLSPDAVSADDDGPVARAEPSESADEDEEGREGRGDGRSRRRRRRRRRGGGADNENRGSGDGEALEAAAASDEASDEAEDTAETAEAGDAANDDEPRGRRRRGRRGGRRHRREDEERAGQEDGDVSAPTSVPGVAAAVTVDIVDGNAERVEATGEGEADGAAAADETTAGEALVTSGEESRGESQDAEVAAVDERPAPEAEAPDAEAPDVEAPDADAPEAEAAAEPEAEPEPEPRPRRGGWWQRRSFF